MRLTALFYFFKRFSPLRYVTHGGIELSDEISEDFDEETMYHYCVFLRYRESEDPTLREKAFVNGVDAAEAIETASNLHYEVASLGEELARKSEMSDTIYYGKYINKEKLLTMASKCGEKSISTSSVLYDYYLTYSSILEILDDYEKALDVLRSGRDFCVRNRFLERPNMGDLSADQVIPTFDERIEAVQKDQKRNQLEKSLRNASTRIDDLNSDINDIETNLKSITDRYRSQVIQFIGFFGAILTIALTSTQIATQLTFPQSGGLILILVGGIIVAFGELSVLFDPDTKRNNQYIITLLIGLSLIAVGLVLGVLVLD